MSIHSEQRAFDKFKAEAGEVIGCLIERNPESGQFDAVTEKGFSVQTGKKLPAGTKFRIWAGNKTSEVL